MNNKSASRVQREIDEALSGEALAYWNGCSQEIIDEMVILGQRNGVEAAIAEIEELSKPAPPSNEFIRQQQVAKF